MRRFASIRSSSSLIDAVAGTNKVVSKPAGTLDGDLLAFLGIFPSNPGLPTITLPGGWTQQWQTGLTGGSTSGKFTVVCATKTASSEPTSWTFVSDTSDRAVGVALAIRDWAAIDQISNNTTAVPSSGFDTPTITPSVSGCLIITLAGSFVGGSTTLSFTPDSPFTEYVDIENAANHSAVEVATFQQNAAASITEHLTASVTCNYRTAGILAISGKWDPRGPAGSFVNHGECAGL